MPDELCWLEGSDLKGYLRDVLECHVYALHNRDAIADNIIRKGAISAKEGKMLLIPLNMRDGSLLCIGKGNPEWNYSAPHGAGRVFSRKQAKKKLSLDEFKKDMEGIYTTSVCEKTLDEAPEAYKQGVEELVGDTVKVIDRLKTVYNFKAK